MKRLMALALPALAVSGLVVGTPAQAAAGQTGTVTITMQDLSGPADLGGAVFELYTDLTPGDDTCTTADLGEVAGTATTDAGGVAVLDNVPLPGSYCVKQTAAAPGHGIVPDAFPITVDTSAGTAALMVDAAATTDPVPTGTLTITPTVALGKPHLGGAVFEVYTDLTPGDDTCTTADLGEVAGTATTDAGGVAVLDNVPLVGSYCVKQTSAAPGFLIPERLFPAAADPRRGTIQLKVDPARNTDPAINPEGRVVVTVTDLGNPGDASALAGTELSITGDETPGDGVCPALGGTSLKTVKRGVTYGLAPNATTTATVGADGRAVFTGIPTSDFFDGQEQDTPRTYCVRLSAAAPGYEVGAHGIPVAIDFRSATADAPATAHLTVDAARAFELPQTGGAGRWALAGSGVALIGGGAVVTAVAARRLKKA